MLSIGDLTVEIKALIEKSIDAGCPMPAQWIVHAILSKHPVAYDLDRTGKCDSEYSELARHELARNHVRRVLRLFKNPDPEFPTLPGFARLLKAYSMNQDDNDDEDDLNISIVPIDQISDEALLARADYYEAMGAGCYEHADEIRRYVEGRRQRA
jgi:hypothetical protein